MGKRFRQLTQTATDADLIEGNYFGVDTPNVTKKVPANLIAKQSDVSVLQTKTDNLELFVQQSISASAQLLHGFINGFGFVTSGGVGAAVDKYTTVSASVKSMEIQCVVGDKFVIYGTGGETYRLYAFLDDERKIILVATINKDASDGLLLVAPENTASIVVNIVGDGSLYELSKESNKNANNKFVNDAAVLTKTSIKNVTSGGYIATNGNHGDVVGLTPTVNASYVHQVIPVKQGDRFFVYGACGDSARLWCFVDGENKIVVKYRGGQLDNLTESEIDAPCDGKLIVNFNKSTYDYDILGLDASKASAIILNTADDVEKNCYIYDEQSSYNGYIATNVGVGNAVSYDVVYSTTYTYAVIACVKGDSFFIKGTGGSSPRLWCFVDNSDKVITVADSSVVTGDTGLYLTAPADGKFIYNSSKSVTHIVAKRVPLKEPVVRKLDFLLTSTPVKKDIIDYSMASRGRIVTNVGIGNVVSYDVVVDYAMVNVVRSCSKNDEFYIRGKGGAESRLWCFVDSNDKVVDAAIASLTVSDELKLVAPCDGKFIFNSNISGDPYCKIWWSTNSYVDGRFASIEENVRELQDRVIEFDDEPYSDITDYSADITNFAMTNMMELVNPKFDTLVSEYPSLITKYDAAELVDMEYPRYANGVPAGDPDYRETPAYKLYIYKISDINANVGNTGKWPKKKLFIIGAIHGYEELAGFNLFAYASHILRKPGKDLFALLAKFDIWIMPFVNGYGIIHGGRTNGNGVDLNRNFGTSGWTVHGELGDNDYSGQNPDSEFETQLLEALYSYIQPDFYVDHHCTPHYSSSQIYSITRSEKIWNQSYMALVELSRGLIKFKPAYFGTKYHLFDDSGLYGTLPKSVSMPSDSMGHSQSWFYEHDVESLTLEIMAYINYLNGEVSEQVPFGDDVHVVNEMSLRCQLDYYLRAVMG